MTTQRKTFAINSIVIGDAKSAQGLTTCDCGLNFYGEQAFYSQCGSERIACLINGSKLTLNDFTIASQPRIEGKVLAIDQKRSAITVNTDLFPVGETTRGQILMFKDLMDGAYEIDSIRRGKDGVSIIKLANEPIISFDVGQRFIFITRSLVTLRPNGKNKRESNVPCKIIRTKSRFHMAKRRHNRTGIVS